MARGFGLYREEDYADVIEMENIDLDWFQKMSEVKFDLGDEPETDDGGSRSDDIAWAGVAKPSGSTAAKVDLQRMTWYLFGFLDQYLHTAGEGDLHIHEFWGGENHELPSFGGIAMYDDLKLAIFGLLMDALKLEVSDSAMDVNVDWIYADESSDILDIGDEFEEPDELEDSRIPVRFFDVYVYLNGQRPGTVQTSLSLEGNNNHDQDGTIGLSSRLPQEKAQAAKRTLKLSLATTLNRRSYRDILDARYGEVGAVRPHKCKIIKIPFKICIVQCEDPDQKLIMEFPQCTLKAEFDLKGADRIEATLSLQTLGNNEVELNDGSKVNTDIYCKLINKVPAMVDDSTP